MHWEKLATVDTDSLNAYVAVKIDVDYSFENESDVELDLGEEWTAVEGYEGFYVYNTIVKANDKLDVFNTVSVPKTWGNEAAEGSFNINITAYAVQADAISADEALDELKKLAGM